MVSEKQAQDRELAEKLGDIDDKFIVCRARGFVGHDWPSKKLRPGKPVPRGLRPVLQRDGTVLMSETCNNCGKGRWWVTTDMKRHYTKPDGWTVVSDSSSRDFDRELLRRLDETIMTAARRNQEPDERGAA